MPLCPSGGCRMHIVGSALPQRLERTQVGAVADKTFSPCPSVALWQWATTYPADVASAVLEWAAYGSGVICYQSADGRMWKLVPLNGIVHVMQPYQQPKPNPVHGGYHPPLPPPLPRVNPTPVSRVGASAHGASHGGHGGAAPGGIRSPVRIPGMVCVYTCFEDNFCGFICYEPQPSPIPWWDPNGPDPGGVAHTRM